MADLGIKNNRVVYLDANGNTVYKLLTADGSANQVLVLTVVVTWYLFQQ